MTAPSDRVYFRVVHGNPPTLTDVTSPAALGKPFSHSDPSLRRLWIGISCYATEAQARRNVRRFHTHGAYIAAIRIEEAAPIRVEKTLGAGHYTLGGLPADLLARIISVVSVWRYTPGMHYELWDAESANVIAVCSTEAEGLALVRQLLATGWDTEHLSFGVDFDEGEDGDDADLPHVQYGAALAERARGAGAEEPVHRA